MGRRMERGQKGKMAGCSKIHSHDHAEHVPYASSAKGATYGKKPKENGKGCLRGVLLARNFTQESTRGIRSIGDGAIPLLIAFWMRQGILFFLNPKGHIPPRPCGPTASIWKNRG